MQPDNPLLHTKHVFRMAILLVGAILAIILGRAAFVPKSWGEFGWFRGDNLEQQRQKPVVHGGDDSCKACHEEQYAKHAEGKHQPVRCEVCHAPIGTHASATAKIAEMPRNKSKDLCLRCHRALEARPKGFPQIQPRQHVDDNGGEWSDEVCIDCHTPHSPL